MVDSREPVDRDRITREQVQALWNDGGHWVLGIIYSCREDPRVIVLPFPRLCHRRRVQRGCRGLGPVPRGQTAPMTFLHEGRQYLVTAVAGPDHAAALVALRLP